MIMVRVGLASYPVGFGAIGPDSLNGSDSASLRGFTPVDRWGAASAGWAEPGIQPKSLRKLEIFFSKLFYKLQTNLNSNQI
jgi:hypothetical protein